MFEEFVDAPGDEAIGVSAVYNPQRNQVRLGADPVASTACRRTEYDQTSTPLLRTSLDLT